MGRQEVRAAQIQQFSLWVKPFLGHQEKTTLSTGGSCIEAIIWRQLNTSKHDNWYKKLIVKSKIYAAALLQTPLSLAMMEKLRVSTSEPFLEMWKQSQFIMTLAFKTKLQVTTETLRPSANRSISVPTTAMADCSSKVSSSLLIIRTLTVFSSIQLRFPVQQNTALFSTLCLSVCMYVTGVTSQLFLINWWFRPEIIYFLNAYLLG